MRFLLLSCLLLGAVSLSPPSHTSRQHAGPLLRPAVRTPQPAPRVASARMVASDDGLAAGARRVLKVAGQSALLSLALLIPGRLGAPGRSISLQRDVWAAPATAVTLQEWVDIRDLSPAELREELAQRGYATSGSRKDLLTRLRGALDLEKAAEAETAPAARRKGPPRIVVWVGKGS